MKSATFYKFISALLAVLLALGGAYAAKTIHDARLEVDHFRQQQTAEQGQLDKMRADLEKSQEIYQRLQNDQDFLDRIVRARLDYARSDELIFRFNVDPLTGASPLGNIDNSRLPLNTSLLPSQPPPASTNSGARRH